MKADNFTLSVVSISDDLVSKVATRCSTSPEKVREYLESSQQNDALLTAFLFYGVGPFNKFFASSGDLSKKSQDKISMGTRVGETFCPACADGVW